MTSEKRPAITPGALDKQLTTNSEIVPLDADEQAELDRLEGVVLRGLDTFVEVGNALTTIRDSRLYRQTHTSFERYLEDRYDGRLSRRRAYQLMDAADVCTTVHTAGAPVPTSERQARELVGLAPDVAAKVMQKVTEGSTKVTAETIAATKAVVLNVVEPVTPDSGQPTKPKGRLFSRGPGMRRTRIDPDQVIEATVMRAEVLTDGIFDVVDLSDLDVKKLSGWSYRITDAIRGLRTLQNALISEQTRRLSMARDVAQSEDEAAE